MEMALVRFGRFVNTVEGHGRGQKYIQLGKFLLDCRKGGSKYDQSHVPVIQQYEAVGHAVRASYNYAGMSDVAMETHDVDYQTSVDLRIRGLGRHQSGLRCQTVNLVCLRRHLHLGTQ